MTDDIKDLASQVLGLTVLKRIVAAREADVRERAQMAMDRGARWPGFAGDTKIGTVTLTDPKPTWRVVDRDAWFLWVKANHPDEIVTTEAVRSSFETALLGRIQASGEIPDGVDLVEVAVALQVKPDVDAAQVIAAELAANGVTLTEWLDSFDRKAVEARAEQ